MPTRRPAGDAQAPHGDPSVVDPAEGHPFDHDGGAQAILQPVPDGADAPQVAEAFLAAVGHEPDIGHGLDPVRLEHLEQGQQAGHTQAVVAQAGAVDAFSIAARG